MSTLASEEELARSTKPNTITVLRTSHYNGFVHPDPPDHTAASYALASPRRDYVLTGLVVVNLAKTRRARRLVVRFVCEARLAFPDQEWEDDVIYEKTLEIGDEAYGLVLEPGPQRFDFSFVVPSTIAGFDRNTYGRVTHRVEATLIGQPTKLFGGFFGSTTTISPPSTSRSPSPHYERHARPRSSGSPTGMGFGTRRSAQASPVISPIMSPVQSPLGLPGGSGSASSGQLHDVKWLQGSMHARKDLWIIPIPSEQPEAIVLDHTSTSLIPGLGVLRWSLQSDAIAVGSYVKLRAEFPEALPRDADIHCVRLYIQQTIALKSPRRPDEPERVFPPVSMVIVDRGKVVPGAAPGKEREKDADKLLWSGRGGGQITEEPVAFEMVARLPDENRLRCSTCPGTITPIRMSHQFCLQVYFSIENQDVEGRPLPRPGAGTLRRAEIIYPFLLPHCACISVNFALPTYEDALTDKRLTLFDGGKNDVNFDICACGLPMASLAERELERGRTAEERREQEEEERRGRDLERTSRKAQYESTSRGRTL